MRTSRRRPFSPRKQFDVHLLLPRQRRPSVSLVSPRWRRRLPEPVFITVDPSEALAAQLLLLHGPRGPNAARACSLRAASRSACAVVVENDSLPMLRRFEQVRNRCGVAVNFCVKQNSLALSGTRRHGRRRFC